ncbi:MAG: hypothetical protein EZS28_015871 [Streblomastix strix]|uniref:Uncharacterized protein n=1 Tax=Streblomastix strix TaxID=222440 RepID=A0A5J4W178_9EUKA|nr:MAG: hypothetical protein EZS28_015871 [Streblomastix strix]
MDFTPINFRKPEINTYALEHPSLTGRKELKTNTVNPSEIINMEHFDGMMTLHYQPKEAKSHQGQRNYQM